MLFCFSRNHHAAGKPRCKRVSENQTGLETWPRAWCTGDPLLGAVLQLRGAQAGHVIARRPPSAQGLGGSRNPQPGLWKVTCV